MALNIKNAEVERLAAEAAALAATSKTEAIRLALEDRVRRLRLHVAEPDSGERLRLLAERVRREFPSA